MRIITEMKKKEEKREILSGLYLVRSESLKVVYVGTSRDVGTRVRKFRSDYGRGKGLRVLDNMGTSMAGDVEFEVIELCEERKFLEMSVLRAAEWIEKGYFVYGMKIESGRVDRAEPVFKRAMEDLSRSQMRLQMIMEKHGVNDRDMVRLLDRLEEGIEAERGRG